MKDRIPTYPNRIRLTPVSGQENVYDLERADEPVQVGTPLNKSTLLDDVTVERLGGNAEMTPKEAINATIDESAYAVGDVIRGYFPQTDNWLKCDGSVIEKEDYPDLHSRIVPKSKVSTHTFPLVKGSSLTTENETLCELNGYYVTIVGGGIYYRRKEETNWNYNDIYTAVKALQSIYSDYFVIYGIGYVGGKYIYACLIQASSGGNRYFYFFTSDSLEEPPNAKVSSISSSISAYRITRFYTAGEYAILHGACVFDENLDVTNFQYSVAFPNTGMTSFKDAQYIENRWIVAGGTMITEDGTNYYYPTIAVGEIGKKAKETQWYIFRAPNGSTSTDGAYRCIMHFSKQKKVAVQSATGNANYGIVDISGSVPVFDGHFNLVSHTAAATGNGPVGRSRTTENFVHTTLGTFKNREDVTVQEALSESNAWLTADPGNQMIDENNFRYFRVVSGTYTEDRNLYKTVVSVPDLKDSDNSMIYKIKAKETGNLWGVTE